MEKAFLKTIIIFGVLLCSLTIHQNLMHYSRSNQLLQTYISAQNGPYPMSQDMYVQ